MSQDVATRLGALSQDHREGRLSLSAYRSLRAPLLDMLVTPEPAAGAEPTVTREVLPRGDLTPAALDPDPSTTTRPRHALASPGQVGQITSADSLVEASALAHMNMQEAARAEHRSNIARERSLHPMAMGVAALLLATAGFSAAWMMRSAREPLLPMAARMSSARPELNTTAPAARQTLTPMPPDLPADAERQVKPSPATMTAADVADCELRVISATALTTPCRDRLSATEFGPRMLLLGTSGAHGLAFAISARPVSQAQFRAFCQSTSRPYPRQPWSEDDDPVVNVTWDEAREYLAWLSSTTGKRYRLPTEADWLYFASQARIEVRWRAGNVREWMLDAVDDRSSNGFSEALNRRAAQSGGPSDDGEPSATDEFDATDANNGDSRRVVRGVSYADSATELLTARRTRDVSTRDALTGFRALREVSQDFAEGRAVVAH